jgi:hypothetical protein
VCIPEKTIAANITVGRQISGFSWYEQEVAPTHIKATPTASKNNIFLGVRYLKYSGC